MEARLAIGRGINDGIREINFLEPKKQASLFGETFDEEFADECEGLCGV